VCSLEHGCCAGFEPATNGGLVRYSYL